MMGRLRSMGEQLEEQSADTPRLKQELMQARQEKDQAAAENGHRDNAATTFLERVGAESKTEPEWTAEEFVSQLPTFDAIAMDIAQEEGMSLPELYKAIEGLVSEYFASHVNSKLGKLGVSAEQTLEKYMDAKRKYILDLLVRVSYEKTPQELDAIKAQVAEHYGDLLKNIFG